MKPRTFVVIGAGPAGLTAALELVRHGFRPHVLERSSRVGGLARTEVHGDFRFDMGGHRFFTKLPRIAALWQELLGEDFLKRPRLSRIYFKRRFFRYPLRAIDALVKVGPVEALRMLSSYVWAQFFPRLPETTFEHWVTNRFGRRLFKTFFESYTEKVWGVSCSELRAEWAAQRIKDLSVRTVLRQLLSSGKGTVTSLIEEFHYPRLGPGMMWERAAERVGAGGGQVELNAPVASLRHADGRITSVVVGEGVHRREIPGTDFIASMPIPDLIACLDPEAPPAVREAAGSLRHRDFLIVCLIVNRRHLFPDNWIYIHDASVKVARIQNFKNWSADMAPGDLKTTLGLEYFCNEGDAFWTRSDADLIATARAEMAAIGLASEGEVEDGCVFRVPKAYPLYDAVYAEHLNVLRTFMAGIENCQMVGRNGLHRYNNQDHSMLTGLLAVENAVGGGTSDLWNVNTEPEYSEEARAPRAVPAPRAREVY